MKHGIQIQYDENFEQVLKLAAKAGFKYVSLGFGFSKCFHESDWEKHIIRIEKLLNQSSIECIQSHTPYYDLRISAETIDPIMDKAMLRCIEASGKLCAKWVAYHPRTAINDNYSPRKSMKYAKIALTPLVEAAAKFNTGIGIENLPVFPGLSHMKFFSSDYEDLIELHDYFNTPHVGICWDFGHAHLMKWENEADAIKTVGNRIKCTHIHSNKQLDDDHLPPLLGNTDWRVIMPKLKKVYDGALMLEIDYKYNPALESYFKYSLENLKHLEGLVLNS